MSEPSPPSPLADRVLDLVDSQAAATVQAQVSAVRLVHGLTRFANSRIHQHVGEHTTSVELRLQRDGRAASVSTSRITDDGLAALVTGGLAHLDASRPDPDLPDLTPAHPVSGLDHVAAATAQASPDDRARLVAAFVEQTAGFDAAGYVETRHIDAAVANSHGHRAADASTLAVVDGIARGGAQAGMGHQAARSLADLDGVAAGRAAADLARRGTHRTHLDAAALPVVLGPEAVATIAVFLGIWGFNARAVAEQRSFVKLGETQFDAAISLRDDVTDPRSTGLGFDAEGTAKGRVELIADGRCVSLAHDRRTAEAAGTDSTGHHIPGSDTSGPVPTDLVMAGGTATPDELTAGIERGVYVTAFNYCRVLDPRTLVVTGLTRNGTFLIEDGRVGAAVDNLRFTQSFSEALGPGRVLAVGSDDRYADSEFAAGMAITPSLALSSWNFTGDARG